MDDANGSQSLTHVSELSAYANPGLTGDCSSFLALSVVAAFYSVAGTKLDLVYNAALLAYFNWDALTSYISTATKCFPSLFICTGIMIAALLSFAPLTSRVSSWQGPGQPYLIPCKTTHRRLLPKKHSFSYSYLTVGIPVDFRGSVNGMIGVDEDPVPSFRGLFPFVKVLLRSWYYIQASDHLQRDHSGRGLRERLNLFLLSEVTTPTATKSTCANENKGLEPACYPYAYLITAARFAGYNFNPVSLWYLYSMNKKLSAIVLEVNNTFDERRPYLLVRDATQEPRHITPDQRRRIKGTRVKDFHVSPFNSRNGYYSVLTSDPLGPEMDEFRGIDVTISLNSSKDKPKLIARLFSDGPAVDPALLSSLVKFIFLAKWFWVGFATLPRIFWQAAVLLYRLRLDMSSKPEPLVGTLGRHATPVEESLEVCFSQYLELWTSRSGKPLSVKYYTSGPLSCPPRIFTSSNSKGPGRDDILELRVLTPAFYSRFIQYWDDLDAVITELNIHKTIWVDKPKLLSNILGKTGIKTRAMSLSDRLFASLVITLRDRPSSITLDSALEVSSPIGRIAVESKEGTMSTMDAFIVSNRSKGLKRQFQWAAPRQLIADRYFMGRTDLLGWMTGMARVGIAYACIQLLTHVTRVTRT